MPFLMSARTLVSSRILLVPAALMREVIKQDAALMQATMQELAVGYRGLVRALTDMKLRQSAERLGNYLLEQSARRGNPEAFEQIGRASWRERVCQSV